MNQHPSMTGLSHSHSHFLLAFLPIPTDSLVVMTLQTPAIHLEMRKLPSPGLPIPVPGLPIVAESAVHARTVESKRLSAAVIAPLVNDARMRECLAHMVIGSGRNCSSAWTRWFILARLSNWALGNWMISPRKSIPTKLYCESSTRGLILHRLNLLIGH